MSCYRPQLITTQLLTTNMSPRLLFSSHHEGQSPVSNDQIPTFPRPLHSFFHSPRLKLVLKGGFLFHSILPDRFGKSLSLISELHLTAKCFRDHLYSVATTFSHPRTIFSNVN